MHPFEPTASDEVRLTQNSKLFVISRFTPEGDSEWWKGRDVLTGESGLFPANRVRVLSVKEAKLANLFSTVNPALNTNTTIATTTSTASTPVLRAAVAPSTSTTQLTTDTFLSAAAGAIVAPPVVDSTAFDFFDSNVNANTGDDAFSFGAV